MTMRRGKALLLAASTVLLAWAAAPGAPLKVLFLGGTTHAHNSDSLNMILAPALVPYGISLTYTTDPAQLNRANLANFDALYLFTELGSKVDTAEASDMIAFVEGGKGLVISHVGILAALGNPRVDSLFGGRFLRHGHDTFQAETKLPSHPAMLGVPNFRAYDETYEHDTTNNDRVILQVRNSAHKPPEAWTWVRTQGKGRVYYTAAGHGSNVWVLPAFQKQMAVAMLWAAGKSGTTLLRTERRRESPKSGIARGGLLTCGWPGLNQGGCAEGFGHGSWWDLRGRAFFIPGP